MRGCQRRPSRIQNLNVWVGTFITHPKRTFVCQHGEAGHATNTPERCAANLKRNAGREGQRLGRWEASNCLMIGVDFNVPSA